MAHERDSCHASQVLRLGRARAAVLIMATVLVVALTACGSSESGSSPTLRVTAGTGSQSGCLFPGFQLPKDNSNPHGSTPQQALSAFLAGGSIFGDVPPSKAPGQAGYPTSGWKELHDEGDVATFGSGNAELTVTRVGHDSWVVTGGQKNCF